jgi:hypothetical protein
LKLFQGLAPSAFFGHLDTIVVERRPFLLARIIA